MPTYEYECAKCGAQFEAFQKISDPPLTTCKKCGKTGGVTRLISRGTGLIFKGSGFYITDYKRSGTAGTSASKDDDKPKSEKPAEKKAETPAASKKPKD